MNEPTEITAAHIPAWDGCATVAKPERMPARLLAELSDDDLLRYTFAMQDDIDALRVTLHEAVHLLTAVTRDRDRLRAALRGSRR